MYARIYGKAAGRTPEDEATSCIFGPLRMLGAMAPGKTWAACLHLFQCGHLFPGGFEPTDVDVRFWPRFPPGRRGYVEPDVHVIARRGADVRTILIEVKRDNLAFEEFEQHSSKRDADYYWAYIDERAPEDAFRGKRALPAVAANGE